MIYIHKNVRMKFKFAVIFLCRLFVILHKLNHVFTSAFILCCLLTANELKNTLLRFGKIFCPTMLSPNIGQIIKKRAIEGLPEICRTVDFA